MMRLDKLGMLALAVVFLGLPVAVRCTAAEDDALEGLTEDIFGPGANRIEELTTRLAVGDVPLRAEAAWELAQTGHTSAVAPLLEALDGDPPDALVPHLAIALGWLAGEAADKSVPDKLLPLLQDDSVFTRTAAIWALGRIGDAADPDPIRGCLQADDELERFLAQEALARLEGQELLSQRPLRRSLTGATILHASGIDADATRFLFAETAKGFDLHFDAATANPWNPTMRKLGGLSKAQAKHFADRLAFDEDGRPLTDLVLVSALYPHELGSDLRWRLWHYVRRGGKLILGTLALQPAQVSQLNTQGGKSRLNETWRPSFVDSLLPEKIERGTIPPAAAGTDGIFFGCKAFGRGQVLLVGFPCTVGDRDAATLGELFQLENKTWRHLVLEWGIGRLRADDPGFWRRLFAWMLGGDDELAAVNRAAPADTQAPTTAELPLRLTLDGPDVFGAETRAATVRIALVGAETPRLLAGADLTVELRDMHGRALRRRTAVPRTAADGRPTAEATFDLSALPPGGYWWTARVMGGDTLLGEARQFCVRMAPWQFRRELIVLQWAGYLPLPPEGIEAFRSIGLWLPARPPEDGLWTWGIHSPAFLPRGQWPADILAGTEGESWREKGRELARHPYFTCHDTVEETDLEVGSQILRAGDVEREGHEQYRIYLKRKYRSLAALNAAWGSDYADWSEIRLLDGLAQPGDHMIYTHRIGTTSRQMVEVPEKPAPGLGFTTLQPYHDQNAWRWQYIWELLEIRHFAFHQTDLYHPVHPGGHMGLSAPFDVPHTRLYANNSLSTVGLRATLGRETYGTAPHVVLMGMTGDAAANRRLIWSALANGARIITIYAPGDGLGVALLKNDYTLTDAALTLKPILDRLLPTRQVLLSTRNAVDQRVLFYSGGTNPYAGTLRPELYEALVASGILLDYGSDLAARRVVFCASPVLSPKQQDELGAYAAAGGCLILLPGVNSRLSESLGIRSEQKATQTPPSGQQTSRSGGRVTVFSAGDKEARQNLTFASSTRQDSLTAGEEWTVSGRYEDGTPALLSRQYRSGRVWHLSFDYRYSSSFDLAAEATTINEDNEAIRNRGSAMLRERYAPAGTIRREAENYRRVLTGILRGAGVEGACRAVDASGSTMPYVEALLLETDDGTQRYLAVYADYRLPKDKARAAGRILLAAPEVRQVHDCIEDKQTELREQSFPFDLAPGEGTLFALLTEPETTLELVPEGGPAQPEIPFRLGLKITRQDGTPSACQHAVDLSVAGPDGKEIQALRRQLSVRGNEIVALHAAHHDPVGEWRVVARDLTSGQQAEATIHFAESALDAPPPATPFDDPAWRTPAIAVDCPPVVAPAQANFTPLRLRLTAADLRNEVSLRISLDLPETNLLAGDKTRLVRLSPDAPAAEVEWDLFLSRQAAIAFYYSQLPRAFATDAFRPETQRLMGRNLPAIQVETIDGEVEEWVWNGETVHSPDDTLRQPVKIEVMPFAERPIKIGTLHGEPLEMTIFNGTGDSVRGTVVVDLPPAWRSTEKQLPFNVASGQRAALKSTLAVAGSDDGHLQPQLGAVSATVMHAGRSLDAGSVPFEWILQREWLIAAGDQLASGLALHASDAPPDMPNEHRLLQRRIGDARVPLAELLPKPGDTATAWAWVSSNYHGEVTISAEGVGASVTVWINGARVYDTENGWPRTKTESLMALMPAELRAGPNRLVVQVQRNGRRYSDPALTFRNADGEVIRNLSFRAEPPPATAPQEETP